MGDEELNTASGSLVSVVVPIYNGAAFLQKALDSCLAQTWQRLEVILVDDGSLDASREIADNFASRHPHFRCVHHSANAGVSAAWNTGFSNSSGDYFLRLAQDDWLESTAVETMISTFQSHPDAGVVYADYWVTTNTGEKKRRSVASPEDLFKSGNNIGLCVMISRKVWDSGLRYNSAIRVAEDYDYFLRVSESFPFVRCDGPPLLNYLRHSEAGTYRHAALQEKETAAIKARGAKTRQQRARIYAEHYATAAFICRDRGEPYAALRTALAGICHAPLAGNLWKQFLSAAASWVFLGLQKGIGRK
jgi:glycosyltransferase involved in cell wall biosynthesis